MLSLRTSVAIAWLVLGLALFVYSVWGDVYSWRYFHFISGSLTASAISAIFSFLAMLGAVLSLRSRTLGSRLLNSAAIIGILYALAYVFLGGYEDAPMQSPAVGVLTVLAGLTLYVFGLARSNNRWSGP
jgi:hypothetical protein